MAITPDVKQHGVWLLHEAREQMAQGDFDAAQKKIAEAEAIDVKWGLFDDTPAKVRNDLSKERPKNLASMSNPAQSLPHNRENAHALLREARAALANHQIDQAEAIAQEVKSWNLRYSLFGENPDKVAAAARALRKRDKIRNTPTREQPSQGVYDVLVQESRQLMKLGKLNEAEAKALRAQRMNVVPALTADRAESVLHDIAMARVRSVPGSPAATPAAEPPSLVAEHEANDLLDKGDQAKAAAKFVESETLRDKESGRAAIGQACATAAQSVDASIQKSAGAEPATEPPLAAPGAAGSPTPDKPAAPAPDSQPKPEPPGQGDALAAPGAAGSPTPDKPAAPAPDSQPKPEPPGQGDALAAPGAAGSPTPDKPAAPAPDSQPKPEPPGQGDALAAPGAAGSPAPDKPAAPAPDSQPKPEPPGQGDALAAPGAAGSPTPDKPAAPAPDSQPKPEPPGQGDALAAPGAAGSPAPDKPAATAVGPTATDGTGSAMTPTAVQAAPATTRVIQSGDPARGEACDVTVTPDVKQHGVWLLHEAREQMALGNFDAAEKKIAEAEAIDVKWGLFDDTPAKVRNDLNKERPKTLASMSNPAQSLPHNRETANAMLREARAALANHQFEQAEAIAQEVKGWNLSYSLFEDNPDKVAAAARALRKRDKIRNTPHQGTAQPGRLRRSGPGIPPADEAGQARRGRGQGAAGPADERRAGPHGRSCRVGPPRHRHGPGPLGARLARRYPGRRTAERGRRTRGQRPAGQGRPGQGRREVRRGRDASRQGTGRAAIGRPCDRVRRLTRRSRRVPAPSRPRSRCLRHPARMDRRPLTSLPLPAPDSQPKPEPPGQGDAPVALVPADQPKNPPGHARPGRAAKADAPVALAPADQPNDQPPAPPEATQSPAGKGQQMLAEARALYTSGNYPAARQMAEEAKTGKLGVDGQADELLAQIGLAEQGGALSLYESALAAMRSGDNARARALLTEVPQPAPRSTRTCRPRCRNCSRSCRPTTRPAHPGQGGRGREELGDPRRRGTRRPEAQRRGWHQDRRGPPACRRPTPTRPSRSTSRP